MAGTPFRQAVAALNPTDDFVDQHRHSRKIVKNSKDEEGLEPIRIAILASSTADHFVDVLRAYLLRDGYRPEFFVAEFNTMFQMALDGNSNLYAFRPDIVWIFTNHRDLNFRADTIADAAQQETEINDAVSQFGALWAGLQKHCTARIIQNNADRPAERVLGNYEFRHDGSLTRRITRFNNELHQVAPKEVHIFDLAYMAELIGLARWHDKPYWYHSKHAFSPDAIGPVAHAGARLVRGLMGRSYKCIVLDLDNTIWGGVIGDDGVGGIKLGQGDPDGEAFLDFQRYVKALKARGVIVAVCSKNEEVNAIEAFETHPEMALSLDDIAVFVCNWINKAENIRVIANTLEIGLDSLVFVDDNPAERALVREMLPMVAVPELTTDPSLYCTTLDREGYFELASFSDEDRNRGRMYRDNAQRKTLLTQITDVDAFLKNLDMRCTVGRVDEMSLPRVVQLINKSNQFHLTTTRYSEQRIADMLACPEYECLYFKLEDRFGDNGLISAVILKAQEKMTTVDTWVMSCRVLSRGMEDLIHNEIIETAQRQGSTRIRGIYSRTKKNDLVAGLYDRLGWTQTGENDDTKTWEIEAGTATHRKHQIKRKFNE